MDELEKTIAFIEAYRNVQDPQEMQLQRSSSICPAIFTQVLLSTPLLRTSVWFHGNSTTLLSIRRAIHQGGEQHSRFRRGNPRTKQISCWAWNTLLRAKCPMM